MSSSRRARKSAGAHAGDDVVIEILARLPTRSLRRFQCVSKAWRGFVSDDVLSRRRSLLPMSGLFFYTWPHMFYPRRYDFPDPGSYAHVAADHDEEEEDMIAFMSRLRNLPCHSTSYVIHSCNGLMLFRDRKKYGDPCHPYSYFVWNPATDESVHLPDHPGTSFSQWCFLAFDPRESPHYKVVRFAVDGPTDRDRQSEFFLQIYSSMSGDWIELTFPAENPVSPTSWEPKSVFLQGALHMLASSEHLVRFDVDKANFRVLLLPEGRHEESFIPTTIGESRGHLYCAVKLLNSFELRIWVLDEGDDKTWLLKHTLSCAQILHQHPVPPNLQLYFLAFNPDSDVIYLTGEPDMIFAYHPGSGRLEEVLFEASSDCVNTVSYVRVFIVTPCLESLNPPGGKLFGCYN